MQDTEKCLTITKTSKEVERFVAKIRGGWFPRRKPEAAV